MLWEGITEGWASGGEGSIPHGLMLASGDVGQEIVCRMDTAGGGMLVEKDSELRGGKLSRAL